jgi:Calcineurin-like phosphoesterase.
VVFIPELNEKLIVVTDLHGDLISLNNILKETDFEKNMESANPNLRLVFLGDYINSGVNSIGVLERLMELKIKYPKYVTLLRGNNEVPGDKFGKDKDYYKWEKIRLSPDKQQEMIKTMGQVKRHSYFVFELMAKYGNTDSEDIYENF